MKLTKKNLCNYKHGYFNKVIAFIITATVVLCLSLAVTVSASTITYDGEFDLSSGNIVIENEGIYLINQTDYLTISTTNTIKVNADCTIYLGGINIIAENASFIDDYDNPSPIDIAEGKTLTLSLLADTTNTVKFADPAPLGLILSYGSSRAAVHVPSSSTLVIEGSGTIMATGSTGLNRSDGNAHGGGGAGIGGNGSYAIDYESEAENAGTVIINGGIIYATGGNSGGYWGHGGAGIGGGGGSFYKSNPGGGAQNVTINAGKVYVCGGNSGLTVGVEKVGYAIGGGAGVRYGALSSFSINGGEVYAKSLGTVSPFQYLPTTSFAVRATITSDGSDLKLYEDSKLDTYRYMIIKGYALVYDANGGVNPPVYYFQEEGPINTTITRDMPFRARYSFIGWATTSDGPVSYYPGSAITSDANITLYAVWSPINTQLTGTEVTGTGNVNVSVEGSIVGDTYLNTVTFELYKCTAENTWTFIGNIKGETGATGPQGKG